MNKKKVNKKERPIDFPVSPPEASERLFEDDYISDAASATECTGLVQVPLEYDEDMTAYEDIYSYRKTGDYK